ncbi:hypothetical protein ABBQ32_013331 [Trebouxia sp. C0010 RCD-2024]
MAPCNTPVHCKEDRFRPYAYPDCASLGSPRTADPKPSANDISPPYAVDAITCGNVREVQAACCAAQLITELAHLAAQPAPAAADWPDIADLVDQSSLKQTGTLQQLIQFL